MGALEQHISMEALTMTEMKLSPFCIQRMVRICNTYIISIGGRPFSIQKFLVILFCENKNLKIMGNFHNLFLHMSKFIDSRNPPCT